MRPCPREVRERSGLRSGGVGGRPRVVWGMQEWRVSWALPPPRKLLPLYQWIWDSI